MPVVDQANGSTLIPRICHDRKSAARGMAVQREFLGGLSEGVERRTGCHLPVPRHPVGSDAGQPNLFRGVAAVLE